jgi:two-component system, sensor histidine kinase and response regulator
MSMTCACRGAEALTLLGEDGYPVQATGNLACDEMRGSVLLVEDMPANREVAQAMLAALGIPSTTADNGHMAVQFVRDRDFDLVLMDCQMPVMDGFEATTAIRALPNDRGKIPIVALTANAMHGDERKCLGSGMDDFLAKPFTFAQLEAKLRRWLPCDNSEHGSTAVTLKGNELRETPADDPEIINMQHLATLRDIGAKTGRDLVAELLRRFLASADEHTVQVEIAIRARDAHLLKRIAHALKSNTSNLGAHRLAALYRQLELMGREGRIDEAYALLGDLKCAHDRALRRARELLEEAP